MSDITNVLETRFEGYNIPTITIEGKPHWIVRDIGRYLGYSDDGKSLQTKLSSAWRSEFIDGVHTKKIEGPELSEFKKLFKLGISEIPSLKHVPSLLLLTESGVNLVCMKTEKPEGIRLRRFLAEKVLPSIRKHGSYSIDQSLQDEDDDELTAALRAAMVATKSALENRARIKQVERESEELRTLTVGQEKKLQNQEKRFEETDRKITELSSLSYKPRQLDFEAGERSFAMVAADSGWETSSGKAHANAVKRVCMMEKVHEFQGMTIEYDYEIKHGKPLVRCMGLSKRGVDYWNEVINPKYGVGDLTITQDDFGSGKVWHVKKKFASLPVTTSEVKSKPVTTSVKVNTSVN